jgi:hypothetical protein
MTTRTVFAPAGAITFSPFETAGTNAMPAVDGANLDTQISATNAPAWVAFGSGANAGPDAQGSIKVLPGYPLLLTTNAATLAACATNPSVMGGAPASTAAAATVLTAVTQQRGGSVTVTRGTASPATTF